jgi:probable phosphoglycerate mutase
MLTLVLTRHGLTARSTPEQHLGQKIDIGLSEEGRAQAAALAARLAPISFERVISSPLVRAHQTAELIAAVPHSAGPARPPVELDPRLAEMDYGEWEGLTYEQIEQRSAAERQRWLADPANLPYPGGESGNDVAARARAFLVDTLADHVARHGSTDGAEWPLLVVAHSSLNRILLCVALGFPIAEYRRRIVQGQVNLTVLRFEHGVGPADARLLLMNDLEHLRRPPEAPWE